MENHIDAAKMDDKTHHVRCTKTRNISETMQDMTKVTMTG